MVQTRPGASHHAADTMSRILTPTGDNGLIPDAVPCLAIPNSSVAWQLPPQTEGGELSPLTLVELLEGQAEYGRCSEVRAAMESNDKSPLREDPNDLLVRTSSLEGAAQVYLPTHMRYGVMMREHYPPPAGHPGDKKMYTSMRRCFYWESMVVDVYAFREQLRAVCAEPRRKTSQDELPQDIPPDGIADGFVYGPARSPPPNRGGE